LSSLRLGKALRDASTSLSIFTSHTRIVIGNRGVGKLSGFLLGSVTEKVTSTSMCDVLIVK